jgi:predicted Co/Zn/Cd cation transporter (cation efflux family)
MSYVPSAMMDENEQGTVRFALRFLKMNLFITVLFSAIGITVGLLLLKGMLM